MLGHRLEALHLVTTCLREVRHIKGLVECMDRKYLLMKGLYMMAYTKGHILKDRLMVFLMRVLNSGDTCKAPTMDHRMEFQRLKDHSLVDLHLDPRSVLEDHLMNPIVVHHLHQVHGALEVHSNILEGLVPHMSICHHHQSGRKEYLKIGKK